MNFKKISVLLVLTLFIISTASIALAEDDDVAVTDRVAVKKASKVRSIEIEPTKDRIIDRAIALDKNVRKDYKKTRDRYLKAKEHYKTSKAKWEAAKKRLKTDKSIANKEEALESAKEHITATLERMIEHLTYIKSVVEDHTSIANQEAVLAEISEKIEGLETLKEDTEAATTKRELVAVVKKVRAGWNDVKKHLKRYTGLIAKNKSKKLANAVEKIVDTVEAKISRLNDAGVDTTSLEEKLDEIKVLIENAKADYNDAKADYKDADTVKEADAVIKEANKNLREAYKQIKELVKELREEFKELKESDDDVDDDSDDESDDDSDDDNETDDIDDDSDDDSGDDNETDEEGDEQ